MIVIEQYRNLNGNEFQEIQIFLDFKRKQVNILSSFISEGYNKLHLHAI